MEGAIPIIQPDYNNNDAPITTFISNSTITSIPTTSTTTLLSSTSYELPTTFQSTATDGVKSHWTDKLCQEPYAILDGNFFSPCFTYTLDTLLPLLLIIIFGRQYFIKTWRVRARVTRSIDNIRRTSRNEPFVDRILCVHEYLDSKVKNRNNKNSLLTTSQYNNPIAFPTSSSSLSSSSITSQSSTTSQSSSTTITPSGPKMIYPTLYKYRKSPQQDQIELSPLTPPPIYTIWYWFGLLFLFISGISPFITIVLHMYVNPHGKDCHWVNVAPIIYTHFITQFISTFLLLGWIITERARTPFTAVFTSNYQLYTIVLITFLTHLLNAASLFFAYEFTTLAIAYTMYPAFVSTISFIASMICFLTQFCEYWSWLRVLVLSIIETGSDNSLYFKLMQAHHSRINYIPPPGVDFNRPHPKHTLKKPSITDGLSIPFVYNKTTNNNPTEQINTALDSLLASNDDTLNLRLSQQEQSSQQQSPLQLERSTSSSTIKATTTTIPTHRLLSYIGFHVPMIYTSAEELDRINKQLISPHITSKKKKSILKKLKQVTRRIDIPLQYPITSWLDFKKSILYDRRDGGYSYFNPDDVFSPPSLYATTNANVYPIVAQGYSLQDIHKSTERRHWRLLQRFYNFSKRNNFLALRQFTCSPFARATKITQQQQHNTNLLASSTIGTPAFPLINTDIIASNDYYKPPSSTNSKTTNSLTFHKSTNSGNNNNKSLQQALLIPEHNNISLNSSPLSSETFFSSPSSSSLSYLQRRKRVKFYEIQQHELITVPGPEYYDDADIDSDEDLDHYIVTQQYYTPVDNNNTNTNNNNTNQYPLKQHQSQQPQPKNSLGNVPIQLYNVNTSNNTQSTSFMKRNNSNYNKRHQPQQQLTATTNSIILPFEHRPSILIQSQLPRFVGTMVSDPPYKHVRSYKQLKYGLAPSLSQSKSETLRLLPSPWDLHATVFGSIFFNWVTPLLDYGYKEAVDIHDLDIIAPYCSTQRLLFQADYSFIYNKYRQIQLKNILQGLSSIGQGEVVESVVPDAKELLPSATSASIINPLTPFSISSNNLSNINNLPHSDSNNGYQQLFDDSYDNIGFGQVLPTMADALTLQQGEQTVDIFGNLKKRLIFKDYMSLQRLSIKYDERQAELLRDKLDANLQQQHQQQESSTTKKTTKEQEEKEQQRLEQEKIQKQKDKEKERKSKLIDPLEYEIPLDFGDNLQHAPGRYSVAITRSALYRMYWDVTGRRTYYGILLKFFGDCFSYLPAILLNLLLDFAKDPDGAPFWGGPRGGFGYSLAFLLVFTNWCEKILNQNCFHVCAREGARARSLTMALVYRKILSMSSIVRTTVGAGLLNNIITTDANRTENIYWMGFYVITAPIQCAIAIAILIYYIGVSALIGVLVLVLMIPIQLSMSRLGTKLTNKNQKWTDKRMSGIVEVLQGIKTIKMHNWETTFISFISSLRQQECRSLLIRQIWNGVQAMVLQSAPSFVATGTFLMYVLVRKQELTPKVAFTALPLFNILQTTLWALPWVVQYCIEFHVALGRIAAVLSLPDKEDSLYTYEYRRIMAPRSSTLHTQIQPFMIPNSEFYNDDKIQLLNSVLLAPNVYVPPSTSILRSKQVSSSKTSSQTTTTTTTTTTETEIVNTDTNDNNEDNTTLQSTLNPSPSSLLLLPIMSTLGHENIDDQQEEQLPILPLNIDALHIVQNETTFIPLGEIRIINTDFWLSTYSSDQTTKAIITVNDPTSLQLQNRLRVQYSSQSTNRVVIPLPTLHIPKLIFPQGSLTCIVGPIGSGKSLLLSCILGDIPSTPSLLPHVPDLISNLVQPSIPSTSSSSSSSSTTSSQSPQLCPDLINLQQHRALAQLQTQLLITPISKRSFTHPMANISYVPQTAWIIAGTIRDNIILDAPYIPQLFLETIQACALDRDIAVMPEGDLTPIAERGSTLSGGQKQRISISRAVYRRHLSSIFIFDSPLSALDSNVSQHIYQHVLGPNGLLKDKTRILVTHQLQWTKDADQILSMQSTTTSQPILQTYPQSQVTIQPGDIMSRILQVGTFNELTQKIPPSIESPTILNTVQTTEIALIESDNILMQHALKLFAPLEDLSNDNNLNTNNNSLTNNTSISTATSTSSSSSSSSATTTTTTKSSIPVTDESTVHESSIQTNQQPNALTFYSMWQHVLVHQHDEHEATKNGKKKDANNLSIATKLAQKTHQIASHLDQLDAGSDSNSDSDNDITNLDELHITLPGSYHQPNNSNNNNSSGGNFMQQHQSGLGLTKSPSFNFRSNTLHDNNSNQNHNRPSSPSNNTAGFSPIMNEQGGLLLSQNTFVKSQRVGANAISFDVEHDEDCDTASLSASFSTTVSVDLSFSTSTDQLQQSNSKLLTTTSPMANSTSPLPQSKLNKVSSENHEQKHQHDQDNHDVNNDNNNNNRIIIPDTRSSGHSLQQQSTRQSSTKSKKVCIVNDEQIMIEDDKNDNSKNSNTSTLVKSKSILKNPSSTIIATDGTAEPKNITAKKNSISSTETRAKGEIGWATYLYYLATMNSFLATISILFAVAQVGAARYTDIWLTSWSSDSYKKSSMFYLTIYAILQGGAIFLTFITNVLCAIAGVHSSKYLHQSMLSAIFFSPLSFFDITPLGRISNRFSSDIASIDTTLPIAFFNWINLYIQIASFALVIIFKVWYLIFLFIPIGIIFAYISANFRRTCRELRRLEATTRSPIFILVDQTIDGVESIHCYTQHLSYLSQFSSILDEHWRPRFLGQTLNRWLAARLDLLGNFILLVLIGVLLTFDVHSNPTGDTKSASLLGLLVTYALTMTGKLNWLVRNSVDTENQMNTIERVTEYCRLEPEWLGDPYSSLSIEYRDYTQQAGKEKLVSNTLTSTMTNMIDYAQKNPQNCASILYRETPASKQGYKYDFPKSTNLTLLPPNILVDSQSYYISQGLIQSNSINLPIWPRYGNIQFSHICARYRPKLPLVIKDISCDLTQQVFSNQPHIQFTTPNELQELTLTLTGKRIALVGRTGSGKSTIIQLLLRLINTTTTIDYHQHCQLGLYHPNPTKDKQEKYSDDNHTDLPTTTTRPTNDDEINNNNGDTSKEIDVTELALCQPKSLQQLLLTNQFNKNTHNNSTLNHKTNDLTESLLKDNSQPLHDSLHSTIVPFHGNFAINNDTLLSSSTTSTLQSSSNDNINTDKQQQQQQLIQQPNPYPSGILIDGIDIATIPLNHLRQNICVVPQEPILFTRSIRFNLTPEYTPVELDDNVTNSPYGTDSPLELGYTIDELIGNTIVTQGSLQPVNGHMKQPIPLEDVPMWKVLHQVQLITTIASLPSGLDYTLKSTTHLFSLGQRQLLCLARTMLKLFNYNPIQKFSTINELKQSSLLFSMPEHYTSNSNPKPSSRRQQQDNNNNNNNNNTNFNNISNDVANNCKKILLLDEATSSVDTTTENMMNTIIRDIVKTTKCTVISIAHHLHAILDYDLVIVMEFGQIAEMGHPKTLLSSTCNQNPDTQTKFYKLVASETSV